MYSLLQSEHVSHGKADSIKIWNRSEPDTDSTTFLTNILKPFGCQIRKELNDGSCGPRVIANGIFGDSERHLEVREHVVEYLIEHRIEFETQRWDAETFDAYIERMSKFNTWVDYLFMIAAARAYGVNIVIVGSNGYMSMIPSDPLAGMPVTAERVLIAVNHTDEHFDSVQLLQESSWETVGQGKSIASTPDVSFKAIGAQAATLLSRIKPPSMDKSTRDSHPPRAVPRNDRGSGDEDDAEVTSPRKAARDAANLPRDAANRVEEGHARGAKVAMDAMDWRSDPTTAAAPAAPAAAVRPVRSHGILRRIINKNKRRGGNASLPGFGDAEPSPVTGKRGKRKRAREDDDDDEGRDDDGDEGRDDVVDTTNKAGTGTDQGNSLADGLRQRVQMRGGAIRSSGGSGIRCSCSSGGGVSGGGGSGSGGGSSQSISSDFLRGGGSGGGGRSDIVGDDDEIRCHRRQRFPASCASSRRRGGAALGENGSSSSSSRRSSGGGVGGNGGSGSGGGSNSSSGGGFVGGGGRSSGGDGNLLGDVGVGSRRSSFVVLCHVCAHSCAFRFTRLCGGGGVDGDGLRGRALVRLSLGIRASERRASDVDTSRAPGEGLVRRRCALRVGRTLSSRTRSRSVGTLRLGGLSGAVAGAFGRCPRNGAPGGRGRVAVSLAPDEAVSSCQGDWAVRGGVGLAFAHVYFEGREGGNCRC